MGHKKFFSKCLSSGEENIWKGVINGLGKRGTGLSAKAALNLEK